MGIEAFIVSLEFGLGKHFATALVGFPSFSIAFRRCLILESYTEPGKCVLHKPGNLDLGAWLSLAADMTIPVGPSTHCQASRASIDCIYLVQCLEGHGSLVLWLTSGMT